MRKLWSVLILGLMIAIVVSGCTCGVEPVSPTAPAPQPTATSGPEPTSAPTIAPSQPSSPISPTPTPPDSAVAEPESSWQADGIIADDEYANQIESGGVTFHWYNDAEHLYAALVAETEGWVSVGFDPELRMQGANFILGYVTNRGAAVQDMFGVKATGPNSHPPDEELGGTNDLLAYAGREESGVTTIEFKIPLDSGDEYDKALQPGQTVNVILAMGQADDAASYHSSRGGGQIVLD